MKTPSIFLLALAGCATAQPKWGPSAEDQSRMQSGCQQQIAKLKQSYCDAPPKTPPVGYADIARSQRNAVGVQCKDAQSTSAMAQVDVCIQELQSHE
jgi:hypothetical protein